MKMLVSAVLRSLEEKGIAPAAVRFVSAGMVLTVRPKKKLKKKREAAKDA